MTIKRPLIWSFATMLTVLVILISPLATPLWLSLVESQVDGLSIKGARGSLFADLNIEQVAFTQDSLAFSATKLNIQHQWTCLLSAKACIQQLSFESASVLLHEPQQTQSELSEPRPFSLPIEINLDELRFKHITIALADNTQLQFSNVYVSGNAKQNLITLDRVAADHVAITLAEPQAPSSSEPQGVSFEAMSLPVDVQLGVLEVGDIAINRGVQELVSSVRLTSTLAAAQQNLDVTSFKIQHPLGQVMFDGQVRLDNNLPLSLAIDADLDLSSFEPQLDKVTLQSKVSGSLDDLRVELSAQGITQLNARLSADLSDAQIPFQANASWTAFDWQLDTQVLNIQAGLLSAHGTRDNAVLQADTEVVAEQLPRTSINLSANTDGNQLDIELLRLDLLGGTASVAGTLGLSGDSVFAGLVRLTAIDTGLHWPDYPANINGTVMIDATRQDQKLSINVPRFGLGGYFREVPLALGGALSVNDAGEVDNLNVELVNGDNLLSISGRADLGSAEGLIALNADIQAPDIRQAQPFVGGQIVGALTAKHTLGAPVFNAELQVNSIASQWINVGAATLSGTLDMADLQSSQFTVNMEKIGQQTTLVDALRAEVSGTPEQHTLSLQLNAGDVQMSQRWEGETQGQQWVGQLVDAQIDTPAGSFSPQQPVLVDIDTSKPAMTWSNHCWRSGQSALCFAQALFDGDQASWRVDAANLPFLPWADWLVAHHPVASSDARLSFSSQGQWDTKTGLGAIVELSLSPAVWTLNPNTPVPVEVDQLTSRVQFSTQQIDIDSNLSGPLLGSIESTIQLTPEQDTHKISGQVNLDRLQLDLLSPLQSELQNLAGQLNANLRLGGHVGEPQLFGDLVLGDGAIKHSETGLMFDQINTTLAFAGQSVQLRGTFQHPDGSGAVEGRVNWREELSAELDIDAQRIRFRFDPLVDATLSPDLAINYQANTLSVAGDISLDEADFVIESLPESAVSPSLDTVIIESADSQEDGLSMQMDINVIVDPDKQGSVSFDAFGLTTKVDGTMNVVQTNGHPSANGQFSLNQGRFQAYGQNLQIRQGYIQFSGPLDQPYLDVEAIRDPAYTSDNVIAGLRITGPAQEPIVSVFSEPEMAQDQALAYLLTGNSPGNQESEESNVVLTNLLLSYGLKGSDSLSTRFGDRLGIENLQIGTSGQGAKTMLTVSGYLAPGLQVHYGVGVFDSIPQVALRYEWMPNLYLEAVSSLESALDIYYTFSHD